MARFRKKCGKSKNCAGKCLPVSLSTIENEPVFALPKATFTAKALSHKQRSGGATGRISSAITDLRGVAPTPGMPDHRRGVRTRAPAAPSIGPGRHRQLMTQPHHLLHAMTDPTGWRGHNQLCAIDLASALPGRGDSRSDARHPRMRDQGRRDSIVSVGRRRSALPGARTGDADSP